MTRLAWTSSPTEFYTGLPGSRQRARLEASRSVGLKKGSGWERSSRFCSFSCWSGVPLPKKGRALIERDGSSVGSFFDPVPVGEESQPRIQESRVRGSSHDDA